MQPILNENFEGSQILLLSLFYLGLSYKQLNLLDQSLAFFQRLLKTSWFLNDKSFELLSYDQIGLVYYNLGEIKLAKYYHEKMMNGDYEKHDSLVRQAGVLEILRMRTEEKGRTEKDYGSKLKYLLFY